MSWHPIELADIQTSIKDSLDAILNELKDRGTDHLLASEVSQLAMLYAYLHLRDPSGHWHDLSIVHLNLAIERFSWQRGHHLGLYGGVAGLGWMVQHAEALLEEGSTDHASTGGDTGDVLGDLDKYLLMKTSQGNNLDAEYDLITGHVGLGIYWIERFPRASAIQGIRAVIHALDRSALRLPDGVTWFTPASLVPVVQKAAAPNGYYNLGVAHGVPGIIGFLAQVPSLDIDSETTRIAKELLGGAIEWLFSRERPTTSVSRFSAWDVPGQDCGDTRMAWCYGDPGIAGVLRMTDALGGQEQSSQRTSGLIERLLGRTITNATVDAPLCHGAFGVAHIFNRLWQLDGSSECRNAAQYWYAQGLNFRRSLSEGAGYFAWRPDLTPPEHRDFTFLSGLVGIALSLLAATSSIEPSWDRLLLLSSKNLNPQQIPI